LILFAQKPQLVIKSGLQSEVMMASISPDNKVGLTVEENEVLILWELSTGKQLQSFPNIMAADFRLDNKTIDIVTNQYKFQTIDYNGNVVSQSPINNTGKDKHNRLNWSYHRKSSLLLSNASIYTRENGFRGTIRINKFGVEQDYSDERNAISIPFGNDVTLCKVPSGEIIKELNFNLAKSGYASDPILEIKFTRFSPDGRYLMAGNNNSLEILDINTGQRIYSYIHPNEYKTKILNLAGFSPDSKKIFIHTSNEIILVNLETKQDIWRIKQADFHVSEYGSRRGVIRFRMMGKRSYSEHKKILAFSVQRMVRLLLS
jgi:WD40 repeat protein